MAKDPAVLFYTSDFMSGCLDLDMNERGQYITLLCAQHQKGALSEKTIRLLVGSVSVSVLSKFKVDENGNYYNERMKLESEKRAQFIDSRHNNGLKGGRPKNHKDNLMVMHMGNHMENENENRNDNEKKKGGAGGKQQLMRNSPYFDFAKFVDDIDPKYHIYDLAHYHESALSWSDAGQKKKADWLATIRSWILKDIKANTPKLNKDDYRNQKVGRITVGAMQDFASRRSFAVDEPPGT